MCRRGMRELDVLLERFVNDRFDDLSAAERADFVHLLSFPDQDILSWIAGVAQPPEPALKLAADSIRNASSADPSRP